MSCRYLPLLLLVSLPAVSGLACNAPLPVTGPARQGTATAVQATMLAAASISANTAPAPTPTPPTQMTGQAPAVLPTLDREPPGSIFMYRTGSGDTRQGLSGRFGVEAQSLVADDLPPPDGYFPIGTRLTIPNELDDLSPGGMLLPDAEVVYSPAAAEFDVQAFVDQGGGFLRDYEEPMEDHTILSGAAIVERVAEELSVNPRLLLALLEYRSGWVYGTALDPGRTDFPLGFRIPGREGLYQELRVAGTQLNIAYYGWRQGSFTQVRFSNGETLRLRPTLNAGTVALMHLMSFFWLPSNWEASLDGPDGLLATFQAMFGEASARSLAAGPLLPDGLAQPPLELPFSRGERWSLTGGPHPAWNAGTPRGALDFSPITNEDPCAVSIRWATASAPGIVVRAADNAVALDLDGDGREATGWVVVYLHLADDGLISPGTSVLTGEPLGHPSCEGGQATGKHVHLARKFNGEWLEADGPVPMVLSGWRATADERNYYGTLVRGSEVVTSDSSGRSGSTIVR